MGNKVGLGAVSGSRASHEAAGASPPSGFDPGDPVVGHMAHGDGSHSPLRQSQANAIWEQVEKDKERRIELMPGLEDCLRMLGDVSRRLKDLGWRDAIYCPKDGSTFDVIEFGSTGIHTAHYQGDWPNGSWWVHDAGDLWPSRPVLFRPHAIATEAGTAETQSGSVHDSASRRHLPPQPTQRNHPNDR